MKISIIGAGSIIFTRKLIKDLLSYPDLRNVKISLMDIDSERLDITGKIVEELIIEAGSNTRIVKTTDLESAVEKSDFVINTVQIGGQAATEIDFDIPEKYGLKQTIADTHGVGGIFRFLRTVPFLRKLVSVVERKAPGALLINFTNPMSMCMWYIKSISDQPAIGLCHSVPHTVRQIAGYIGLDSRDINFSIAGINHMAWVLELSDGGRDLYPLLREAMENPAISAMDPVRFDIMKRFSYFVTESSEHMSEYVPFYIKNPAEIDRLNIPIREYLKRLERHAKAYEIYKDVYIKGLTYRKSEGEILYPQYFGAESSAEEATKEYAIEIIDSLVNSHTREVYAIVENRGAIENLPFTAQVEVPCIVNGNGIRPVCIGALPTQLAALNMSQIQVQQLAVKGALEGSKDCIKYALMLDPLASSILTTKEISDMTEELFQAHAVYLDEIFNLRAMKGDYSIDNKKGNS